MAPIESPREVPKTSPDGTGESHYDIAVVRFALIQETLAAIGEGYALPRVLLPKVWDALQSWHELESSTFGPLQAKQAQVEAGRGRPLTICFGKRYPPARLPDLRDVLDPRGEVPEYLIPTIDWRAGRRKEGAGDGCGKVFTDSVTASRPVFARYCSVCREKSEDRRQAESRARIVATWEGRFAVAGGWRLACSGCGERFFATAPQQRRCDRCRH
jgi:hypothetical protein